MLMRTNTFTDELQYKVEQTDEDSFIIRALHGHMITGHIGIGINLRSNYWMFQDDIEEDEYDDLFPDDSLSIIEMLFVEPEYQNQGIANVLMQKAIKYINKQGSDRVYLNACPLLLGGKNLPLSILTQFYEKFKFEVFKYDKSNNLMLLKL